MGTGLLMAGQRLHKLFLLCLLLLLSACAGHTALQTRVTAGGNTKVCSLAVLPFENWTPKPEVDLLAYRLFNTELVRSEQFNVVTEGEVGLFRLRQRLLPGTQLHKSLYAALAEQLRVDVVVLGRVVEAGMDSRRGSDNVPFVALQVDLYDLRSNQLLLSTVHQRWGDEYRKVLHFGLVTTTSGVLQKMSQEIINDWLVKGVTCP